MKTYIYEVAGFEFIDNKAFGEAWENAKQKATENHVAIYRTVKSGEKESREVYLKMRYFDDVNWASERDVKIWS